MDTNSMFGFMDLIVVACGAYGIYSWYMLVKKHEIKKTFLIGGNTLPQDCTDVLGFADYIGTKLLILSITMIAFGAISAYNDYVQRVGMLIWIAMAVFLAVIIWYCVQLKKADHQFFSNSGPVKKGTSIKEKAMRK